MQLDLQVKKSVLIYYLIKLIILATGLLFIVDPKGFFIALPPNITYAWPPAVPNN